MTEEANGPDDRGTVAPIADGTSAQDEILNSDAPTSDVKPPEEGESSSTGQSEKDDETGEGSAGEQGTGKAEGDEPKVLSQDELDAQARQALNLKNTEPQTAEYWKAKNSASSEEARKLVQARKELDKVLADNHGLKMVHGRDGVELIAEEGYSEAKAEKLVPKIVGNLSKDEKELAAEDPDKFAQLIATQTIKATSSHLRPTANIEDIAISDGVKPYLDLQVGGAKDPVTGVDLHPDYTSLQPYMDLLVDDPTIPQDFLKMMNKSEENYTFARSLLYAKVHQRVAPLIAAQKDAETKLANKKKAAKEDASIRDQGTRTGNSKVKGGEDSAADAIIGAQETF